MIGKLIPAGTGMKQYKEISVDYGENTEMMNRHAPKAEDEKFVYDTSSAPETQEEESLILEGDTIEETSAEDAPEIEEAVIVELAEEADADEPNA